MRVRANIEELENLSNVLSNKIEELREELKHYGELIDETKRAYDSEESTYILDKYKSYVNYLEKIPNCYNDINKVIRKSYIYYGEGDEALKKELIKQEEEFESDENLLHQH